MIAKEHCLDFVQLISLFSHTEISLKFHYQPNNSCYYITALIEMDKIRMFSLELPGRQHSLNVDLLFFLLLIKLRNDE